jgi:DNA-binding NtrC family response regulator
MARPRLLLAPPTGALPGDVPARLTAEGWDVCAVTSPAEALERLRGSEFDLVLAERSGDRALPDAAREAPCAPAVLLLDAFGHASDAVEEVRRGAFECLSLPVSTAQLVLAVRRALESRRLEHENRALREGLERQFDLEGMRSRDPRMRRVFDVVRAVADSSATVLIEGESGTGKTMLARALHAHSGRADRPFVHVNCGALPGSLLESELFGHVKGAFTGAVRDRAGKFEAAADGTIFLDEIATASSDLQVKLLRILETRCYERVGDTRTSESAARVVAATNQLLEDEVAAGRFREDLFYRINVVRVELPPLRERLADVPMLVDQFLARFAEEHGRPDARLAPEALALLSAHAWPGNVRQLQHALERAVLLAPGSVLRPEDLGPEFAAAAGDAAVPPSGAELPLGPLRAALEVAERRQVLRALEHTGGNRTAAAALLDINRATLFNKMRKYKLQAFPREARGASSGPDSDAA